ncbi:tyrosine-type recombinase/integrase [Pantoea latae]|uniref:tyrosine-type recombinase/integrase n=1 Tax=Pantoea latae TaxID=1964541 RepID=UPI000B8C43E3|nr:tyrosine-type recombinase/integrase [Pantoea latae]
MSISAYEISRIINEKVQKTSYAARRLRINLSDLFKEVQRASVVPMGHNPALLSRPPMTAVAAARLSLSEWIQLFKCAKYRAPVYFQNAMLLALVTGQRPSDLVSMHSRDVRDGYLYITQIKTGEKIALSLSLYLEAISTLLAEVIVICPSNGLMLQTDSGRCIHTW